MKILITGADGFIGRNLCVALSKYYQSICGVARTKLPSSSYENIIYVPVGDINLNLDWKNLLLGYDCVIHCAGRAHIIKDNKNNSLEAYRLTNVEGTKKIVEQCVAAGVKRLIFLSSIGVLGIDTNNRNPFSNIDEPNPIENYSISKFEAEQALLKISNNTGLETVIIRLPLVYGPSVPGNFLRLIKLVNSGIPLPFGGLKNKRSFIGIDNLINFFVCCLEHPNAAGKTFLVSDGEDLSTSDLLKYIASAMGSSLQLVSVPTPLLKFFGSVIGKQNEVSRLLGSLQVDINYTKKILNWTPPFSVRDCLKRMFDNK